MTQRATSGKTLADRRVEQTRAAIFEAAIDLFVARGFSATSMADIAAAAGVSRRTLYRYFGTKDDIVYEVPRQWLEVFNAVVDERHDDEPTRDLFRRALTAVAHHIVDHADAVLRSYSVVVASPELAARHGRSDAEWVQRYLEILGPDVAGLPHGDLQAATAATALVGAQNALIATWAANQPDADLVEMVGLMLDQLDSVWPGPARRTQRG